MINKLTLNLKLILGLLALSGSAFAMEQENFDNTKKRGHEEENRVRDASDVARLLLSSAEHVSKDMSDRSPKFFTINSDPIVVSGFCEEKIVSNHTNGHNKVDFTKILPQEIISEILDLCISDVKYPKLENAAKSFKNIKTVCKKLNLIAKNFAQIKKIEFKKYDEINKPLFDQLRKLSYQIDYERVIELIKNGADINLQDDYGNNALMFAAARGHTEIVKALIAAHTNLNLQTSNGNTALMMAARNGHIEIVKELIDANADVNIQENDGYTALMLAAINGHIEIVKVLIIANADVNLQG